MANHEVHVKLNWVGPFGYSADGVCPSRIDSQAPTESDVPDYASRRGLYAVVGDLPPHGSRSLIYIGKTNRDFATRFGQHHSWIQDEWRVEVYFSTPEFGDGGAADEHVDGIEKLLIFAHSPHYNSASISCAPTFDPALRIWNTGRFHKLFPEVSSRHPWYSK